MTTILECCWHNTDSLDHHRSTTTRRSSDGFNCGFVALIGRRTTALDEDWGLGPSTSGMQPFVPFFTVPLSSPFCSFLLSKENLRLRNRALQQKSESEMIVLVAVECPAVIICIEMEYVMSKKEPAAA